MKKIVILGSTGSLGTQSLKIIEKHKKDFQIIALSAHTNKKLLIEQSKKFKVRKQNTILSTKSPEALTKLAALEEADIIINVLPGTAGIAPSKAALKSGKTLLLGNKESLVAAGKELKPIANIIPLDSEHNAIYEILHKNPNKQIEKIILPCSGGPFINKTAKELEEVTASQALAHPKWKMGPKISIESATLINKGLEIIEAHYLFALPLEKIEVIIHPECQIHGLVKFSEDPAPLAYLSPPNMKQHIENALLRTINKAPTREIRPLKPNEFKFQKPNHKLLQGIEITLNHFKKSPSQMENFLKKEEKTIQKFLEGKIKFSEIFILLKKER